MALIMLKMAVFPAIPSASITMIKLLNNGCLMNERQAYCVSLLS